jgi:ferredoxin
MPDPDLLHMPRLTLDGRECAAEGDETILRVASRAGIFIPTLCFDSRIEPIGTCRLCCVDVDGEAHPQIDGDGGDPSPATKAGHEHPAAERACACHGRRRPSGPRIPIRARD